MESNNTYVDINRVLVVIDMQNDIIAESVKIDSMATQKAIKQIITTVHNFDGLVILVSDIHRDDSYATSSEHLVLPYKHCIANTSGAKYNNAIIDAINHDITTIRKFYKCNFGDIFLPTIIRETASSKTPDIFLCGAFIDMDVLANAIICKSEFSNSNVTVIKSACISSDKCSLKPAIKILKNNQIIVAK